MDSTLSQAQASMAEAIADLLWESPYNRGSDCVGLIEHTDSEVRVIGRCGEPNFVIRVEVSPNTETTGACLECGEENADLEAPTIDGEHYCGLHFTPQYRRAA
jgi:hypothetical protein